MPLDCGAKQKNTEELHPDGIIPDLKFGPIWNLPRLPYLLVCRNFGVSRLILGFLTLYSIG